MGVSLQVEIARPQAVIYPQPFHQWNNSEGVLWAGFYRTDGGYLPRFPGLADFLVTANGEAVCCWPVETDSAECIEHLFRNQVLSLALSKQQKLVFHANAVAIGGSAIAFVGDAGLGKSTLAASFVANGHPFLAAQFPTATTGAGLTQAPDSRLFRHSVAPFI